MPDKAAIVRVLRTLKKTYAGTTLNEVSESQNPFHVLIATILSQRTRDENTLKASTALFKIFDTPEKLSVAKKSEIIPLIKPAGFYNTKADTIRKAAKTLLEKHGGKVPDTMEALCAQRRPTSTLLVPT